MTVVGHRTTGRLLVQQALQKGHLVTAVVRSPEKFDIQYVYVCTYVVFIHMFLPDVRRCCSMVWFCFFRFNFLCMIKHCKSLFIYQTPRTNLSYLKKKNGKTSDVYFCGLVHIKL